MLGCFNCKYADTLYDFFDNVIYDLEKGVKEWQGMKKRIIFIIIQTLFDPILFVRSFEVLIKKTMQILADQE